MGDVQREAKWFEKNSVSWIGLFLKVGGGGFALTCVFMLIIYPIYSLMHTVNHIFVIFLSLGIITLQAIWWLLLSWWLTPNHNIMGQLGFVLADYQHQRENYEKTRQDLLFLEKQSLGEVRWFVREIGALLYRMQQDWESLDTTGDENWLLNQTLKKTILELEQATQLKDEFIATMSHELRTPLNSIIGYSSMLKGKANFINAENAPLIQMMSDTIYRNGQRLLTLINQILNLQRMELGRVTNYPCTVDLHPLIQECYASLLPVARKKNLQFELSLDPTLPTHIHVDPQLLHTVLLNLLDNAIKFTEQGRVDLTVSHRADLLILEVRDTGIGIAVSWQEKIFEEFRQVDQSYERRYGGSGLGLAIVRKTLRAMGGQVNLQSTINEGSCFTVTVPLIPVGVTANAEFKRL